MNEANREQAARHIRGATIAWGADQYLDLADPDNIRVSLEDYAYCLAYTVRWRGQCRIPIPEIDSYERPFFGVGQHVVFGAEELIAAGYSKADARAFLFHESDELPFGDFPGPAKGIPCIRETCDLAKRIGASVDRGFDVTVPDPDLVKRWDIRMLVTEKRDLLSGKFFSDDWAHDGDGDPTAGYEPFERLIVPYPHPAMAARRFLELHEELTR